MGIEATAPADSPGPVQDIAPAGALIELPEYDPAFAAELVDSLGVHQFVAQTLSRRGVKSIEDARTAIGTPAIELPERLPGAVEAAAAIATHLKRDTRIAVHGDYDVDGACSTAILVRALAGLGADVTWHVPSRFEDGYGLSRAAVDRLAADGVGLIVTVDCGIGSVAEVDHASSLGIDVVICDHHTIGDVLPDAPIVHPGLAEYSTPWLCAAAATHKLAQAVYGAVGADPAALDQDLELVALATVCDVVPLTGENRALVRAGLERMRTTQRPGLRELMRVSGVNQLKLDADSFGFALGPRINAAGRMFSAEPAVELLLTSDETRAAELAEQLAAANMKRRETGDRILHEAEQQAKLQRDRFAIVVAGEGWHPGVLGIVAGRIAEQYKRPAVALAIEGGVAAGSGRSGGVFDLHGGLAACSAHLNRFGGHKAAAGLELDAHLLPQFTRDFAAVAAEQLSVDDLRPHATVDVVAEPAEISLDAIAALETLGPFGAANPRPKLLLSGVEVRALRRMGETGRHLKLEVAGRGGGATVVAFSWEGSIAAGEDAPAANLVVELVRNEFRGDVSPQAKLLAYSPVEPRGAGAWIEEFEAALSGQPFVGGDASLDAASAIDRRAESPVAVVASLGPVASGAVVVANHATEWRDQLAALAQVDRRLKDVSVRSYDDPQLAGSNFADYVLVEPPPAPSFAAFVAGRVTIAWNEAAARRTAARGGDLLVDRPHVIAAYKAIRDAGTLPANTLREALAAVTPSARLAGRAVRSLEEIDVVRIQRDGETVEAMSVVESAKTELDRSSTFRSYISLREESRRWLNQLTAEQTEARPTGRS